MTNHSHWNIKLCCSYWVFLRDAIQTSQYNVTSHSFSGCWVMVWQLRTASVIALYPCMALSTSLLFLSKRYFQAMRFWNGIFVIILKKHTKSCITAVLKKASFMNTRFFCNWKRKFLIFLFLVPDSEECSGIHNFSNNLSPREEL